ncbi:diacylglycerol/lipid kinase family protein [Nibricoccus aquaticus]|nr:diacylglycerol kinase family protein [Nibricoccus aquaticus]
MHVIAILNEKAGTAANDDAVTDQSLREAFASSGFQAEIHLLPPAQIEKALQQAIERRPQAIFVGGGDGTVSATAGQLADTEIPLGVLPLGTLNHFAKDLGLPPDWREAIAALAGGNTRSVDVAEVNGHLFVNNCSIGAYADAVRHREELRERHQHGKWFAMLIASFRVFRRFRRIRFRLQSDDGEFALRSPFLLVANNCYEGNILSQSLRERIDGGQLWIYSTRARRHFTFLRMVWQALRRELAAADALDTHSTTEATVHLDAPTVAAAADGEILELKTPLRFRIRPGALRVLAPPAGYAKSNSS